MKINGDDFLSVWN
jgi:hypothetical protein